MNFLHKCKVAFVSMMFTAVLSCTAASLCGLDFYGNELFAVLIKRVMVLDGNSHLHIEDFFDNMGFHSMALLVFFSLCILIFAYCIYVILSIIRIKMLVIFRGSSDVVKRNELPTMQYTDERLFEEQQESRTFTKQDSD